MTPFLATLLIGIFNSDLLVFAALIAFLIGVFHVLTFLRIMVIFLNMKKIFKICSLIYLLFVVIYFLGYFLWIDFFKTSNLDLVFYIAPIILSLFWSYILESTLTEKNNEC